jgi:hypothetical protein
LGIVVTWSVTVGRSAITRVALLAVVTRAAAIDISPELTLRKSRRSRHQHHRDQFRFHIIAFLITL